MEEVEREEEEMRRKLALQVAAIQGEEMEEDQKATGGEKKNRGENTKHHPGVNACMKFNGEGDFVEWLEEVDRFVQMFQWKGMDVYEFMVLNMTGVAKDFALRGMQVDEGITKEQLFENVEK